MNCDASRHRMNVYLEAVKRPRSALVLYGTEVVDNSAVLWGTGCSSETHACHQVKRRETRVPSPFGVTVARLTNGVQGDAQPRTTETSS